MNNSTTSQFAKISFKVNSTPNKNELHDFFEAVFLEIADGSHFSAEQDQKLDEWFSVDEMLKYLPDGKLIEARLDDGQLVGAIFVGKQNPITWPDGNKMEIFILGVHKDHRGHDIARKLMHLAEEYARELGSKKILVNTHEAMESVHTFYQKIGYTKIGTLENYYDNGSAVFFQKVL
jgi:ribosomal protein S18 acetylase RimI-like enzyme